MLNKDIKNGVDIGKVVKIYRKKNDMTQEILAERFGLSAKYIQFIENGQRNPSIKVVYKIAQIFRTDVCTMFCSKKISKK